MRSLVLITAALVAAACQAPSPVVADGCGATAMQHMVGEPADILALMDLPSPVRIIGPDDIVTLDYREDRLNFYIDESDRIRRITCG